MNQADAIDLSFIPTAINEIHRLLHEAAVAEKEGDPKRERAALVRAGGEAMVALEELHDHPLWNELRQEQQRQLQQWQDLGLPVVDKLLVELGYKPPPPAKSLIDIGNTTLRLAVGLPDPEKAQATHPITLAQQATSDHHDLIADLMKSNQNMAKLKEGLRRVTKTLVGTLVAAIVIPAVQVGVRKVSPHAAELLRELLDHAAHMVPSLSMVLVAGIADEAYGLQREGDQQSRDIPAEYEGFPHGTTRYDSQPYWRDASSVSMSGPQPATERTQRERQGPDDIAGGRAGH
jgi:hypothetical protein